MPSIDLPIDELRSYRSSAQAPPDLAEFWERSVQESALQPLEVALSERAPRLRGVRTFAVTFAGFRGGRVSGWYLRPDGAGPFPGVVEYHGYAGRGWRLLEGYPLAAQGVAVLSMDCRGQAGDADALGTSGHAPGWLTQGLDDPDRHYYRTVFMDAVRAAEVLCSFTEVDPGRVAFTGASQGGGITLAAAALSPRPGFAWADVPFLCDFPRAIEVAAEEPYPEIPRLLCQRPDLEAAAFRTLSYIDVANLAPSISCPTTVTVGLWDAICPPSTIFGAFARIPVTDKELKVYRFHGHRLSYENDEARLVALLSRLGVESAEGPA